MGKRLWVGGRRPGSRCLCHERSHIPHTPHTQKRTAHPLDGDPRQPRARLPHAVELPRRARVVLQGTSCMYACTHTHSPRRAHHQQQQGTTKNVLTNPPQPINHKPPNTYTKRTKIQTRRRMTPAASAGSQRSSASPCRAPGRTPPTTRPGACVGLGGFVWVVLWVSVLSIPRSPSPPPPST